MGRKFGWNWVEKGENVLNNVKNAKSSTVSEKNYMVAFYMIDMLTKWIMLTILENCMSHEYGYVTVIKHGYIHIYMYWYVADFLKTCIHIYVYGYVDDIGCVKFGWPSWLHEPYYISLRHVCIYMCMDMWLTLVM